MAFPIGLAPFCKPAARDFLKRTEHSRRFFALTYYAVRDPRYQRAEVCGSECAKKWKKAKPIRYPSFEEWQALAAQCDETAHLTAGERSARSSLSWFTLIDSQKPLPVIWIMRR
jgi:hypothetical protein